MAKYSPEFKKMVVQDYLRGCGGYTTLAKKYKVKTRNQVENWVKLYRDFGSEGLKSQHSKINYSVQTKVDAVELYLRTELPYREVAKQFGILNISLIANWKKVYLNEGIVGLSRLKGRPSIMPKKNSKTKPNTPETSEEIIKKLEEQNRRLEIENAYLKELRRRGLTDPNFLPKKKSESPTTSADQTGK